MYSYATPSATPHTTTSTSAQSSTAPFHGHGLDAISHERYPSGAAGAWRGSGDGSHAQIPVDFSVGGVKRKRLVTDGVASGNQQAVAYEGAEDTAPFRAAKRMMLGLNLCEDSFAQPSARYFEGAPSASSEAGAGFAQGEGGLWAPSGYGTEARPTVYTDNCHSGVPPTDAAPHDTPIPLPFLTAWPQAQQQSQYGFRETMRDRVRGDGAGGGMGADGDDGASMAAQPASGDSDASPRGYQNGYSLPPPSFPLNTYRSSQAFNVSSPSHIPPPATSPSLRSEFDNGGSAGIGVDGECSWRAGTGSFAAATQTNYNRGGVDKRLDDDGDSESVVVEEVGSSSSSDGYEEDEEYTEVGPNGMRVSLAPAAANMLRQVTHPRHMLGGKTGGGMGRGKASVPRGVSHHPTPPSMAIIAYTPPLLATLGAGQVPPATGNNSAGYGASSGGCESGMDVETGADTDFDNTSQPTSSGHAVSSLPAASGGWLPGAATPSWTAAAAMPFAPAFSSPPRGQLPGVGSVPFAAGTSGSTPWHTSTAPPVAAPIVQSGTWQRGGLNLGQPHNVYGSGIGTPSPWARTAM